MQPFIVRNSHPAPMQVLIEPGQIKIALPPQHVLQIEVLDLPEGQTIEITPDGRPGLTLKVPSTQFKFRSGSTATPNGVRAA
jgi:hypothetical protein